MMHDSRHSADPVLELARNRMELVQNIHAVHLAIISGDDETGILQFDDADYDRMLQHSIPALVHDTQALSVIVSSPDVGSAREGAIVALMERTLETFYAPIVRSSNADLLIGDFRPIDAIDKNRFGPIFEALVSNWSRRNTR